MIHSLQKSTSRLILALLVLLHSPMASAATLNIVTSIKPIQSLVANLTSGVSKPQLLIKGAQSPHTFTLRPSDGRMLQKAHLVIWVGEAMETGLHDKLPILAKDAQIIALLEEQDKEHSGSDNHHQHHQDPHIWLSPLLVAEKVPTILQALVGLDPDHADQYQKNAAELLQRLQMLNSEIEHQVAPIKEVPYIVFHDAFRHFEKQYGLNNVGAIALSPERPPGAKRVAELISRSKTQRARCLFTEPQFQPKLAHRIAESTGSRIGLLDPLGSTLNEGPDGYFLLIKNLTHSFVTCLQQST